MVTLLSRVLRGRFKSPGRRLWPCLPYFFSNFIKDSWNQKVIVFSVFQAFISAILSIIFGFPGAWLVTNFDFPGKRWFRLLTFLPFILPSILVVLAMVQFLAIMVGLTVF